MTPGISIRMSGREHTFSSAEEIRIGRESGNELISDNPLVSRWHARLQAAEDGWVIEDTNSRHGIFVDGTRVVRLPVAGAVTCWLGPPGQGQLVQLVPDTPSGFERSAVFVSYRRGDCAGYATLLHQRLVERFGTSRVFRDVDDLRPGTNFVVRIESAVGSCALLIALIGKDWAGPLPNGQRRLDQPDDFVRLEVATALQLGIRVIPMLVQNVPMPQEEDLPEPLKPLANRHALQMDDSAVENSINKLITEVARTIGDTGRQSSPAPFYNGSGPEESDPTHKEPRPDVPLSRSVSWAWWLLPIILGLIGGLIAWGAVKERDRDRASRRTRDASRLRIGRPRWRRYRP
jgi:TIR domain/FHA domain